jgi:hypothetical protein
MVLNPDAIPDNIREVPRWVVFKVYGGTKDPITPEGRKAKCNDPRTWRSFGECMAAITHDVGHYPALALDADYSLRFYDLDDCINDDGSLSPLAAQILAAAPNTYIERSVSGKGLHLMAWAGEGAPRKRRVVGSATPNGRVCDGLEVYGATPRFCIFTGDLYDGSAPHINIEPPELRALVAGLGGAPQTVTPGGCGDTCRTRPTPKQAAARTREFKKRHSTVPAGSRNNTLFRYAALLQNLGYTPVDLAEELWVFNDAACRPPFNRQNSTDAAEVDGIVRSAVTNVPVGILMPAPAAPTPPPPHAPTVVDLELAMAKDPWTPLAKDLLAGKEVTCEGVTYTDVLRAFEQGYHINHCGDTEVLWCCIYAMVLQSCGNTKGLHAKATGKKGSGKSTAVAAALHLAPPETVCKGSFSDMALFRKVMNIHHPRIMLDDVVLSEKQTANIKRATGAFQERCEHSTIIDNKGVDFYIPARSVFFMTSVQEAGDDQLVDRFVALGTGVDGKDDLAYSQWENEKRVDGRPDLVVTDTVLLARAMLRYIAAKEFVVRTPKLEFAYTNDRRLMNMVWDLMSAHAILYHLQRHHEDCDGVTRVVADNRDLDAIIHMSMFTRVDDAVETRLTPAEQCLHEIIQQDMIKKGQKESVIKESAIYSEQEIADLYGKALSTTRALLYGRGGTQQKHTSGLMAKAPWMTLTEADRGWMMYIKVRKHATNFFGQFACINQPRD